MWLWTKTLTTMLQKKQKQIAQRNNIIQHVLCKTQSCVSQNPCVQLRICPPASDIRPLISVQKNFSTHHPVDFESIISGMAKHIPTKSLNISNKLSSRSTTPYTATGYCQSEVVSIYDSDAQTTGDLH